MKYYTYVKHPLAFNFNARTSRGEMQSHVSWIILVRDALNPTFIGYGEAAPLPGLSVDDVPEFEVVLAAFIEQLNAGVSLDPEQLFPYPSIRFALEVAELDLNNGGSRQLFDCRWLKGEPIPINGLVWMDEIPKMLVAATQKIEAGFHCLKFKVGGHDFDAECRMLEQFRKQHSAFKIEVRLDANEAFANDDARSKLKELSRFDIHSIEQPIKRGNVDVLAALCSKPSIPIALDEELIGLRLFNEGLNLLKEVKPQYVILKPTLLGGLHTASEWAKAAEQVNAKWWATSALESNIALSAIAQWCSSTGNPLPQGLGTGALYTNNFSFPIEAAKGQLTWVNNPKPQVPEWPSFLEV